jgi:hypothetical protein
MSTTPTNAAAAKPQMPTGLAMALKMFGIDPEQIQHALETFLQSGALDRIANFENEMKSLDAQRNRVECKVNLVLSILCTVFKDQLTDEQNTELRKLFS